MKEYIKPKIEIEKPMSDLMLKVESGGTLDGSGDAKRNDFWADEDESNEAFSISDVWD